MISNDNSMNEKEQIKGLLKEIKLEARGLLNVIWTREEVMENKDYINSMSQKIKNMLDPIVENLYWYQQVGWKNFLPNKEIVEQIERKDSITEEKARFTKWMGNVSKINNFYFLFHRQFDSEQLSKILAALRFSEFPKKTVLEIGTREGNLLRKFAEWGVPPEKLVGVDFAPSIIDQAKKLSSQLQFIKTIPDDLPFEDQTFDLILITGVLMHVLDANLRKDIGKELLRVLKEDGLILTMNVTKDVVPKMEPIISYSTIGLEIEELKEIFPNCLFEYERMSSLGIGLGIIKKGYECK